MLNGIALTDAITTDCFLRDFQLTYATLFSGVRHDSGDPVEWGEKMIAHYQKLGINPAGKTLLFSDSLDFARAHELYEHFRNRTKVAFGIGTYISNDTEVPALNIVMKTTLCNGMDVAKISDTPGKGMCKNPDRREAVSDLTVRRAGNVTAEPVKTRCRGREPKVSEIPPSATMTNGKKSASRWTRWSKTVHVIQHWNCLVERFSIRFLQVR